MADRLGQPAYNAEVNKFREWVERFSVTGTIGSDDTAVKHPFMPYPRLEAHLKEENRTKRLLRALFPNSESSITPEDVWRNSIIVFSILLLLGRGAYIQCFIQDEHLWDSKLPFSSGSPPQHFPRTREGGCFFRDFFEQQWHFHPHTFLRNSTDAQIDKECILPIVKKEQVGHRGKTTLYQIELYPAYDHLRAPRSSRAPGSPFEHTYVLKTYRLQDAKENYETEVRGFKALKCGDALGKSVIDFYGSFEQDGSYNILLEFADRGTLEDYMQNTPPPTNGEDIHRMWSDICNSTIKGLNSIHNVQSDDQDDPPRQGYHQDINPSNILVVSGRSGSKDDLEFRIADLDLSHFRRISALARATTDRDSGGTREYGAPECYRIESGGHDHIAVEPKVDIWSLGCILSEVAVWIVHGQPGLEKYRLGRGDETNQLHGFRDGRAFHNGETVLQSVTITHDSVCQNVRKSDHVTKHVIDRMVREMLQESDYRPNTKQLWGKWQMILKEAEKKQANARSEPLEPNKQSQRHQPPSLPPEVHPPQIHPRSHTLNVLTSSSAPSRELTANSTCSSPGEISTSAQRMPTTPPETRHGDHGLERQSPTANSIHPSASTPRRLQDHADRQSQSPPSQSSAQNKATQSDHRILYQPSDQLCDGHDLHESPDGTTKSPSKCIVDEDLSKSTVGAVPSPTRTSQSKIAENAASTLIANQHSQRDVPYMSVGDATIWMLKRKSPRGSKPAFEYEQHLNDLKGRDHVFLVDDAATMADHKEQVVSVIRNLAYVIKTKDDDGVDLCFSASKDKYNSKKSSELVAKVKGMTCNGVSNVGKRLGIILQDYQRNLRPASDRKHYFMSQSDAKPLTIYVLTDGVWQPGPDPRPQLSSLTSRLLELGYNTRNQVGIQLIRFGCDPDGIKKLKDLDSCLGLAMDIVDTEPFDGNFLKMLLGSGSNWFDDDRGAENNEIATPAD